MSDFPTPDSAQAKPAQAGLSDNAAGALAYVTVIPAIVFLVAEPYNRNSFIRFHAWQSIFFSIAAFAVTTVFSFIPIIGWFILLPLSMVAFLVLWIMVLLKALKGERWSMPLIGKYAAQQAGN